ncbi:hypothetical protein MVEN_00125900 [Mycena venus]|uniref:Uncharacterized protein n=1 Tax=Mycena venus TaxID=2733690 RepID=A0A8H7DHP6_9AGAR|nr:hypothetical protein MVEN_00125900 [Mycena venus]
MPKEPTLSTHAAHNTSRPVQQPRKHSAATQATRTLLVEKRNEQALALEADLEKHYAEQEQLIETLVLKYGRTEEYIRKVVCNGVKYGSRRAVNTKNMIAHEYCNKARDEGDPSNVLDVQGPLSGEEYLRIKESLTEEELTRLRDQLAQHRDMKQHGPRATNKACQQDAVQTCNRVGEVLRNLHQRTGVSGIALFTRADDPTAPNVVDSDNMREFFQRTFKMSIYDLLHKMEQWSCTRDRNDEDANTLDAVRSQISEMANDGLRKIKNNKKLDMEWSNYRLKVVHELGVELAGWPDQVEIRPPSKIPADDARRIRDLMRMGKIQWVTLTRSQREEVAEEIEELCATGALPRRKPRCDKGEPCGSRAKKSTTADGVEDEGPGALAPAAQTSTAAQLPNAVQTNMTQVPVQTTDAGAAAAPGMSAPASSAGSQVPAMAGISPSPWVAVPATGASFPASSATLGAAAQPTSANSSITPSQLAFGSNFEYDFNFNYGPYLDDPSFAQQLVADDLTLRLNTSNRDEEDWGFNCHGATGAAGNDLYTDIRLDNIGFDMAAYGGTAPLAHPSLFPPWKKEGAADNEANRDTQPKPKKRKKATPEATQA